MKIYRAAGVALVVAALGSPALAADPVAPIVVAPVIAVPTVNPVTGNISVWGGYAIPTHYTAEGYGDSCASEDAFEDWNQDFCRGGLAVGGDFRVHKGGDGFGFQFEVVSQFQRSLSVLGDDEEFEDVRDPDLHALHVAAAVHAIRRGTSMPFGAFIGAAYTTSMAAEERGMQYFAGLEAARVGASNTIYTQVGGLLAFNPEDMLGNLVFGRVGLRHFFGENTLVEVAMAGGFAFEADIGDDDIDRLVWVQGAATVEHAFGGGPFSAFATYQADYMRSILPDECCDTLVVIHTVKAGIRMSFGGTLAEQNATGARTFTLPNLMWPIAAAAELN